MTTTCPHCGGILIPGQPVCADCGKPTADAPAELSQATAPELSQATAPELSQATAPGGSPPLRPGAVPPVKRDKSKDYSLIGSLIADKYRVLDVLGQGGFGTVYLVEITAGMVGERLALKLLPEELSTQAAFRGQFLNEIRLAMRVVDRYIVQIRDVGSTDDGRLYYTMDLSPGVTLAQVIRSEGRLPVTRASLIVLNVLRALQTAHAAGIIHLDLKPANIMVENQGGKESVRVLDFGIATAVLAQGEKRKGFAGSPHYMPPEQFLGEEVGFSTDLYSVGVILYECVTGQKPYPGSSPREVFNSLKSRPPILPEALAPEVASYPGLSELILRAMERNPERRFQSAKELFDALNAIVLRATIVEATPAAPPEPREGPRAGPRAALAPRAPRRRPLARSARRTSDSRGGLVVMVILTLAAVGLFVAFQDDIRRLVSSAPGDPGDSPAGSPSSTEVPRRTGAQTPPVSASPANAVRPPAAGSGEEPSIAEARRKAGEELAGRVKSFVEDAKKSLAQKHWPGAIERADVALRMDPENAEAHLVRGIAAFESGDFTAAAESLDRVRAGAPGGKADRALLLRLSRAKLEATPPRFQEAQEAVKAALREDPKDPEAVLLLIEILEKEGRLDDRKRVVAAARKGKVASPRIDALWEQLFVVEPKKRREDAAKLAAAAREAFDRGDWKGAAGLADAWGTVLPEDGADILAADALLELGDLGKAKRSVERALERARNDADEDEDDGEEAPAPGEPEAARARLDGRLHLIEGRLRLAEWEKVGKADDLAHAEDSFRKAAAALGKLEGKADRKLGSLASLGLARVAAARGDASAVAEASKQVEGGDEPAVVLEEGHILMLLAERSTASEESLKALNLAKRKLLPVPKMRGVSEKDRAAAHFLLGLANLRLGDLERNERSYRLAVESFAAARQAGLDTAELNDRWALAYDRVGNLVKAAQLYRAAYESEKTPQACLRAAESQLKANPRSPDAIAILEEGARLFPDHQEIQRRYRELRE